MCVYMCVSVCVCEWVYVYDCVCVCEWLCVGESGCAYVCVSVFVFVSV